MNKRVTSLNSQIGRMEPPHSEILPTKAPLRPHVWMALFGAGWALTYDIGVRLYLAEVVALLGLLVFGWRSPLDNYPMARKVIGAFSLWALAIVISDIYNETQFFDTVRNLATPLVGAASLLFCIGVLSRNPMALLSFLAATVVAKGVLGESGYGEAFADQAISWGGIQQNTNFFKVRIEPFLTPAALIAGCWAARKSLLFAAGVFGIFAIGYFIVDARASGFAFFMSALALAAIHARIRPRFSRLLVASVIVASISYVSFLGYVNYTLTYNPNGHNGIQLARTNNPFNPLELMLQGRPEWYVMTSAIAERPVFGWGSWAIDPNLRFTYLEAERSGIFNYGAIGRRSGVHHIPAHSVVGSAWMWSGLLGLVAMVWLLRSLIVMAMQLRVVQSILLPVVVFWSVLIFWHYFFSPPQSVRLSFPIALASLIVLSGSVPRGMMTVEART